MSLLFRRRALALGIVVSAVLGACGGGSSGGGGDIDLYAAYDRVSGGMSYAAAVEAVGMRHNGPTTQAPTETLYQWETGRGTASYTVLGVNIDNERGLVRKTVVGPRGNFNTIY